MGEHPWHGVSQEGPHIVSLVELQKRVDILFYKYTCSRTEAIVTVMATASRFLTTSRLLHQLSLRNKFF